MLWIKKKRPANPPTPRQEFRAKLDDAVNGAVAAKIDLRDIADALESRAEAARIRWAVDAPLF
jgi:hypothetical protein